MIDEPNITVLTKARYRCETENNYGINSSAAIIKNKNTWIMKYCTYNREIKV